METELAIKQEHCSTHMLFNELYCRSCDAAFCVICNLEGAHQEHDVTDIKNWKGTQDKEKKKREAGELIKRLEGANRDD